jgi:apolipoprotein N-acyltransferase
MEKNIRRGLKSVKTTEYFKGRDILLAAFSGFLLIFSFPKFGWGAISWIAFVPLFWALKRALSFPRALFLGFVTGVVCYGGLIYWVVYVVVNYGYLPTNIGVMALLLLAGYLSLYIALFAAFVFHFGKKISIYVAAPVLWVCFEYLKSAALTGFPWENLGYAQYRNIYFIQIADVFGVYGLSFFIMLVNVAVFRVLSERRKKDYVAAGMVLSVTALVHLYGFLRLEQVEEQMRSAEKMEVSLIQGNIDQSIKWNPRFQRETLNRYERLSLLNVPAQGSLLVWPETAAPFEFQDQGDLQNQIIQLAKKTNCWLLFGSIRYEENPAKRSYFNSAYLLSPSGEIKGIYDKVHLVPYGEYVPLRDVFPFINGFTQSIGDFHKGTGFVPLAVDGKKLGVLICYEAILPEAARDYKRSGADMLVTISNDAWFGKTSAPFQHFSMMVLRAVETRLYLIRAANTGISGIVDPAGRILKQTEIFKEDALKGEIKFIRMETFYSKHGDALVVGCFLLFVLFLFVSGRKETEHGDG